jgi:hypothetical protein
VERAVDGVDAGLGRAERGELRVDAAEGVGEVAGVIGVQDRGDVFDGQIELCGDLGGGEVALDMQADDTVGVGCIDRVL